MKNLLFSLLKNPFVIGYLVLYFMLILLLRTVEKFNLTEPLFIFFTIGIGFSALAWWVTNGIKPLSFEVQRPASEATLLMIYLIGVVIFLTWGLNLIESSFQTEPAKSILILSAKLAVFVIVPFLILNRFWKYKISDFLKFSPEVKKSLRVFILMSSVLIIFQIAFGRGASEIRHSGLGGWSLALGIPLVYLWLIVEVGLVEEFFFRALIQSRVAALLRSEIAGVVVMALLFGLAHAPGMYFRTAKTLEAVGPSPSVLMAVGYSIVITSVTGFFLGILWARTKNLPVLILFHAAGDLVPNLVEILKVWQ